LNTELIEKIQCLKDERNAVILAHNYQSGAIQDIADFTGDSLGLSIRAASTNDEVIVFCGVLFMAETAAILSPEKTVLLPDRNSGCPMADMITAGQLAKLKEKHPDAVVVCYVNSTAEVKAISDYCCTSSNAVELVKTLPRDREIIFVPDRYLGQFVIDRTGRGDIVLWPGHCPTHLLIDAEAIESAKQCYPDAIVIAHPECSREAAGCADELLSTGQMLSFVQKSAAKQFIVATEVGIIHTLQKENPEKEFIPATERAICPNMKKITLEKVLWSLEDMQYVVTVPENIAAKAKKALDRMVRILPAKQERNK
jgi:quinolinate synthase